MKNIAKVWMFESDSSPGKKYETIAYDNGETSCNCPAWKFKSRSAGNGRTCKHTRMVDMGIADANCKTLKSYSSTSTYSTNVTQAAVLTEVERPARRLKGMT